MGGDAPITVQSMTKTDTRDVQATLLEIWALEAAGCDVVRCAVPVREAAEKLGEIKRQIRIPLVADIHFNYKLALIALEQGVDGLRLNPGNIGGKKFVMEVVTLAKDRKIPIRIGVNAGSLEKDLLEKYSGPTAEGHGRIRAAPHPHPRGVQLPRDEGLAQGLRSADDDRGLPDARRPGGLRVPPRRHGGGHPGRGHHQVGGRAGGAAVARASATRSASRSRPIPPRKSGSASTS